MPEQSLEGLALSCKPLGENDRLLTLLSEDQGVIRLAVPGARRPRSSLAAAVGVALAAGGLVMWLLLHFTRMLQVMQRAAHRPKGYVDSAVMLNAKLRAGMTLLHVVAMTRSLGEQRSPKDEQPEVFRWTDTGGSYVDCTFAGGKLVGHQLTRPAEETQALAHQTPPAP